MSTTTPTTIATLTSTVSITTTTPVFVPPVPPHPPNYIDPVTLAPAIIGINTAFLTLGLVAVVLRIYSRMKLSRLYPEDWLAVLAWIFSSVVAFFVSWSTKAGMGRHWWDISLEMYQELEKVPSGYIMSIFYCPTHLAIKLSILLFYLRLGNSLDSSFRLAIYLVIFYVVSSETVGTCLIIFGCSPVAASWDFSLAMGAKCLNAGKVYFAMGLVNVLSNLMILLLPVKMLWGFRLPRRQKFQVLVAFGLGGMVTVVSVGRLIYVDVANKSGMEYSWYGAIAALWSAIELNVAIACGCLPAIKILFAHWWPRIFGSGSDSLQPASPFISGGAGATTIGGCNRTPRIGLGFISKERSNQSRIKGSNRGNIVKAISLTGCSTTLGDEGEYVMDKSPPSNNHSHGGTQVRSKEASGGRNMRAYHGQSNIYRGDLQDDYFDEEDYDEEDCVTQKDGGKCNCTRLEGGCTISHGHCRNGNGQIPRRIGYMSTVQSGTAHGSEEHIIRKPGEVDLERGSAISGEEPKVADGITKTTEVQINVQKRSIKRREGRGMGKQWSSPRSGGGGGGGGGGGDGGSHGGDTPSSHGG